MNEENEEKFYVNQNLNGKVSEENVVVQIDAHLCVIPIRDFSALVDVVRPLIERVSKRKVMTS